MPQTELTQSDNRDERGASLVEYALLVALIAIVCILAVTLLGSNLSTSFSHTSSAVTAAPAG